MLGTFIAAAFKAVLMAIFEPVTRWLERRRIAQAERDKARVRQLEAELEAVKNAKIVNGTIDALPPAGIGAGLDELHRLRHPEAYHRD